MDPVMDGSARSSIRATQCCLGELAPGSPAAAALTRRGRTKAYVVVEMCSARDPAATRPRDATATDADPTGDSRVCSVLFLNSDRSRHPPRPCCKALRFGSCTLYSRVSRTAPGRTPTRGAAAGSLVRLGVKVNPKRPVPEIPISEFSFFRLRDSPSLRARAKALNRNSRRLGQSSRPSSHRTLRAICPPRATDLWLSHQPNETCVHGVVHGVDESGPGLLGVETSRLVSARLGS